MSDDTPLFSIKNNNDLFKFDQANRKKRSSGRSVGHRDLDALRAFEDKQERADLAAAMDDDYGDLDE